MVVTGGVDGTVRQWGAPRGEPLSTFRSHRGGLTSVAFSLDSLTFATGSVDRTARLWDIKGQLKSTLDQKEAITALSFSPDGRDIATASKDRTVKLWEVATGKERGTFTDYKGEILAVTFSADGNKLFTAGGLNSPPPAFGELKCWDTVKKNETWKASGHTDVIAAVAAAPDGSLVASGGLDGTARLWDQEKGEERATLTVGAPVMALAFAPDSKTLVTADKNGAIKLWDKSGSEQGSLLVPPPGPATAVSPATAVIFSPDGRYLISAHLDGSIFIWDVPSGKRSVEQRFKIPGAITGLAFATDSRHFATANANGTAYVFRLATFRPRKQ
jgi:WD40 repeat protein